MAGPDDEAEAGDSGDESSASDDAFLRDVARIDTPVSTPTRSDRAIGSKLGRFVLRSELGRGGMGIVYRAHDPTLGRSVALKVLPSQREGDPQRRARFLREARSAASIVHPNVATIYEIGEAETSLFIAMELVPGESLRARFVAGRPMPASEVIGIAKGIARGLAAAHAQGIVHRDLKPENVMVDADGHLKILDFGLAKLRDAREAPRDVLEQQPTDAVSTEQGQLLGTPAYMSPEQAAGKPLDARSDLFSLGVVLYEALTGGRPFSGETSFETLAAVMLHVPVPLRTANPSVPAALAAIVMRCLAKAAADRHASATELLAALEGLDATRVSTPSPSPPPPRSRAVPVLVAIALLGMGALVVKTQLGGASPTVPTTASAGPDPVVTATTPPATPSVLASATATAPSRSATASASTAASAPAASPSTPKSVRPATVASGPTAPSAAPSAKPPKRDPLGDQN